MDVISPSSELDDLAEERDLYARIGIREYFLFQPDMSRPGTRLVGYELGKPDYRRLAPDVGLPGSVHSAVLGLSLRPGGELLRLRDLRTGRDWRRGWKLARSSKAAT